MDYALEVGFALAALISIAGSQVAETFISPLLEKYNVSNTELRKGIFLIVTVVFNLAFMYVFDIDVFAKLLDEHSSLVTLALGAFTGSGVGQYYHGLKGLIGPRKTVFELGREIIEIVEDIAEEEKPVEAKPTAE